MRVLEFPTARVEVGIAGRFEPTVSVRCAMPEQLTMTPNEARTMALALIEHAADVERRNKKERRG